MVSVSSTAAGRAGVLALAIVIRSATKSLSQRERAMLSVTKLMQWTPPRHLDAPLLSRLDLAADLRGLLGAEQQDPVAGFKPGDRRVGQLHRYVERAGRLGRQWYRQGAGI